MIAAGPGRAGVGAALDRGRRRAQDILAGFSSGQKAVTVIAVLTVILGGYFFATWAGKPTYVPLFTNLSASDAAAITQKLTTDKIPYQLADGGASVLVPQSAVYQERLNVSAAGLPSDANSGYKLLDKEGVTTSEFQQQVDYQQAVQTEMDKTIQAINGVNAAVVHVVIPQDNLFSGPTNKPSASVMVQMQPGKSLSPGQVQAIVHLVASSIENLDPANVTVVDDKGDVLSAPGSDTASVAAGTAQGQQTQQVEQALDASLTNMLLPVVGPNNAVVHVSADLNFDQTQTTSKTYDPNKTGPVAVSQASSTENYTGAGASNAAGGTLGQTTTPAGSGSTSGNYTKTDTSQDNAVSEIDKTIQSAPGAINRMSVAVMVNSAVKGVSGAQIQQLVSNAAGLVPSRGDTIQVTMLPFDNSAQAAQAKELKAAASAKSQAQLMSTIRTAAILLVVAAFLIFAVRRLTRSTREPLDLPEEWVAGEFDYDEPALALEAGDDPTSETMALAPIGVGASAQVQALGELIDKDPAAVAQLLRGWLAEDRR